MIYKNAWRCARCPKRNDEEGCPCWVAGVVETDADGNIKSVNECLFQAIPRWLANVNQTSTRPIAAIESIRNDLMAAINQDRSEIVAAICHIGDRQREISKPVPLRIGQSEDD